MLWRQYERERARQEHKDDPDESPPRRRGGGSAAVIVLAIAFIFVLAFPLLNANGSTPGDLLNESFALPIAAPAANLSGQATQLARQQESLAQSMTYSSDLSTQQAYQIQSQMVAQQNVIATQMAQASATEAAQATSTAWSLTQTPMAAEQILRNLEIQKKAQEAQWSLIMVPLKAIVLTLVGLATLCGFVYFLGWGAVKAVNVYLDRMRFVKEDRGERTFHVAPGGAITRPDLMHEPVLTPNANGTMMPSGGAADPHIQERIAHDAAEVKGIQALSAGTKLPGNAPVIKKTQEMPELEFIEGREIRAPLLKDIHLSLDGEESV